MAGKPLDQLKNLTDPGGCHVIDLPSRIWVFGGFCEKTGPTLSLRDAFWRASMEHHPAPAWFIDLDRPEDHAGWLEHSGYSDLLEFERDACYLAKAIILFAESPGAHAELGALAIDEALLSRLAVVVQHRHTQGANVNSFLNLGPLRRVEAIGCLCVIGDEHLSLSPTDFLEITEAVAAWLPAKHKREKLHLSNRTHRMLLIADLIDLLIVSSEPDLVEATAHFGIEMTSEELKKSLGLLKFLQLVGMYRAGSTRYWVRHDAEGGPWIDYTATPDAPNFERARFKIKANEIIHADARLRSIYERGKQ